MTEQSIGTSRVRNYFRTLVLAAFDDGRFHARLPEISAWIVDHALTFIFDPEHRALVQAVGDAFRSGCTDARLASVRAEPIWHICCSLSREMFVAHAAQNTSSGVMDVFGPRDPHDVYMQLVHYVHDVERRYHVMGTVNVLALLPTFNQEYGRDRLRHELRSFALAFSDSPWCETYEGQEVADRKFFGPLYLLFLAPSPAVPTA